MIRTTTSPARRFAKWMYLLPALAGMCAKPAHSQQLVTTIDNYPRYANDRLTVSQELEMRSMATAIDGVMLAGGNIAITVTGHGDCDAQGRDFETCTRSARRRNKPAKGQVMVRGLHKVNELFTLTMAAYNLTQLRNPTGLNA